MNQTRTTIVSALLALLCVMPSLGQTPIFNLRRATVVYPTNVLPVVTWPNQTNGTAGVELDDFLASLIAFPGWPSVSVTNAIGTVRTNGSTLTAGATTLDIIQGSNTVVRATNNAGVVTLQINAVAATGGGGAVNTNLQLQSLKVFGSQTNSGSIYLGTNYYITDNGVNTFELVDAKRAAVILGAEGSDGGMSLGGINVTPYLDIFPPTTTRSTLVAEGTNVLSGPVRLPSLATNGIPFIDGNSNLTRLGIGSGLAVVSGALTASGGGGGGGSSGSTNMERAYITNALQFPVQTVTITATNAVIDMSGSPNVLLVLTTNTHLVFSNVVEGVTRAQLFVVQDTNGTRSVLSARVVGGSLITNGNPWSFLGTNANALSRWTFGSHLGTNVVIFQDASFSDLMASSNALFTALSARQGGSATLTNLAGTGAISNLVSLTLSNASMKPLVVGLGTAAGATNTGGRIRGIQAGSNVTLTENGSNVVVAATVVTNHVAQSIGSLTQTNGESFVITTITGTGGANTNFTGQATDGVVYINAGTTNVNIVAIMPGPTALQYFPVYILTNLTSTDRLLSLSSVTNRWVGLQGYDGISVPYTITNKHTAWFTVSLQGSNAFWAIKQATNGF